MWRSLPVKHGGVYSFQGTPISAVPSNLTHLLGRAETSVAHTMCLPWIQHLLDQDSRTLGCIYAIGGANPVAPIVNPEFKLELHDTNVIVAITEEPCVTTPCPSRTLSGTAFEITLRDLSPEVACPRMGAGVAAALDGWLYVVGGTKVMIDNGLFAPSTTVCRLNLLSGTWEVTTPLPVPLQNAAAHSGKAVMPLCHPHGLSFTVHAVPIFQWAGIFSCCSEHLRLRSHGYLDSTQERTNG